MIPPLKAKFFYPKSLCKQILEDQHELACNRQRGHGWFFKSRLNRWRTNHERTSILRWINIQTWSGHAWVSSHAWPALSRIYNVLPVYPCVRCVLCDGDIASDKFRRLELGSRAKVESACLLRIEKTLIIIGETYGLSSHASLTSRRWLFLLWILLSVGFVRSYWMISFEGFEGFRWY